MSNKYFKVPAHNSSKRFPVDQKEIVNVLEKSGYKTVEARIKRIEQMDNKPINWHGAWFYYRE